MTVRSTRLWWIAFVVVFTAGVVVVGLELPRPRGNAAYAPQPGRNVGWIGPVDDDYTGGRTPAAIANEGYVVVDAFRRKEPISTLFSRVNGLVRSSKARGVGPRILEYFEPTVWFSSNSLTLAPYAAQFRSAWLLRDASGKRVPYYGVGRSLTNGADPIGYLINLADPNYRIWVVHTILQWMHEAPFDGVFFDSAQPLIPFQRRALIGDGQSSFATIFCGMNAPASGCPRLQQWNAGLNDLMSSTSAALRPDGGEVVYNGIAPSPLRGPSRNIAMLTRTDMAANESFCYDVEGAGKAAFAPLAQDLRLMRTIAQASKKVMEITNYQSDVNRRFGSYCTAAFLLGWQPGSSYWLYQRTYSDGIDQLYPEVAERDLNLGHPSQTGYTTQGAILSRTFGHGLVALNAGRATAAFTIPVDMVQFSNGRAQRLLRAGKSVRVAPHQAVFALNAAFLREGI